MDTAAGITRETGMKYHTKRHRCKAVSFDIGRIANAAAGVAFPAAPAYDVITVLKAGAIGAGPPETPAGKQHQ
ncbi:MAG: hypothetical protein J6C98_08175 [Oscillospiraceae bacterium]|nr:hypothetical protein [Oscillospiraceae bacterium]